MIEIYDEQIARFRESTVCLLHALRFRVHLVGYSHLLMLIPCYALDNTLSLTKELYPYAANRLGYASWSPIEHAVRVSILDAWSRRDPGLWDRYFPGQKKPPSNKHFLATLAELIKNPPPGSGRGM